MREASTTVRACSPYVRMQMLNFTNMGDVVSTFCIRMYRSNSGHVSWLGLIYPSIDLGKNISPPTMFLLCLQTRDDYPNAHGPVLHDSDPFVNVNCRR